ncbi:MAG: TolC family protein [Pirellulaceae bacterium]
MLRLSPSLALVVLVAGCANPGTAVVVDRPSHESPRIASSTEMAAEVPLVEEVGPSSLADQSTESSPAIQLVAVSFPQSAESPAQEGSAQKQSLTDQPPREEIGNRFLPPPAIPDDPSLLSQFGAAMESPGERPLTLEELESMSCQNNPTLLQARSQVEGTLGKAIQAGLWPNPTLMYSAEQIGVKGTPGEFQGGIVRQRIVTAHKLDLSREKYLARTRVAEWLALGQQYRVLNDVRVHYFRARGFQDLLQVQRELLKNAEDNLVTVREMYNVGQATRADVHQANVALQRMVLRVMTAENDFRLAFDEMTALVGFNLAPAPLASPLEGDLAPIDWDEALARLIAESPQMLAARSKLEADRITIRREIVEPVPDLIVEGGTGYNFEAKETVGVASVSVEVPLFDWNQGTIRQAEADYARQQGELRRTELLLRRDLARQYRTYLTGLQHVRDYRDVILPESRQAYEILLQSYKEDRAPWADVLAAEQEYFALRGNYIQNLIAWRESEVLIMGFLLHSGLDAPSTPAPPGHINAVPKPR